MTTTADVRAALAILRAAVPLSHPEITEDTVELWAIVLEPYPAPLATQAATAWVQRQPAFPESVAAFERAVRATARANRESAERGPCPECAGQLMVYVDDGSSVRPCVCHPSYADWAAGHWGADHDAERCVECRDRSRTRLAIGQ